MMLVKPNSNFVYRQCSNNECRFRYPAEAGANQDAECPSCGSTTLVAGAAPSLAERPSLINTRTTPRIAVFLDCIRSSYNVGSIFRTADGAGINQVYLGGISPTPDHPKVAKTALGADMAISWAYFKNGLDGVLGFKDRGWKLWALESGSNSHPLFQVERISEAQNIMIIVGNERAGVDPGILDVCDRILSLPMNGQKRSLNVSVAFGVAAYWLRYGSSIDE